MDRPSIHPLGALSPIIRPLALASSSSSSSSSCFAEQSALNPSRHSQKQRIQYYIISSLIADSILEYYMQFSSILTRYLNVELQPYSGRCDWSILSWRGIQSRNALRGAGSNGKLEALCLGIWEATIVSGRTVERRRLQGLNRNPFNCCGRRHGFV